MSQLTWFTFLLISECWCFFDFCCFLPFVVVCFLKVLPLVFCVVAVFLLEGSSQTSLVCGSFFVSVFSVCLLQLKRSCLVMLVWAAAS